MLQDVSDKVNLIKRPLNSRNYYVMGSTRENAVNHTDWGNFAAKYLQELSNLKINYLFFLHKAGKFLIAWWGYREYAAVQSKVCFLAASIHSHILLCYSVLEELELWKLHFPNAFALKVISFCQCIYARFRRWEEKVSFITFSLAAPSKMGWPRWTQNSALAS